MIPADLARPLTDDQLADNYPQAEQWLRRHSSHLKRRSVPNKSWDVTGADWCRLQGAFEHMPGPYLVLVPEQRMPPPAAVVGAVHVPELGRKAIPLPNHKVTFCGVRTLDEALYLAAFINSTPIQVLLESYASSTAVSPTTMARLPIPPYDPSSSDSTRLVAESRALHLANPASKQDERRQRQPTMDDLVAGLLKEAGASVGTATRRAKPARVRVAPSEADSQQDMLALEGITVAGEG